MLRSVRLPPSVGGHLYLYSMPGRYEPLSKTTGWIGEKQITRIVSLATPDEVASNSPSYRTAIAAGELKPETFAIEDYGVPKDQEGYFNLVRSIAEDLRGGRNVLVHCGAGVGRTGMLACCVLIALGLPLFEAMDKVSRAGSRPETEAQRTLIKFFADRGAPPASP